MNRYTKPLFLDEIGSRLTWNCFSGSDIGVPQLSSGVHYALGLSCSLRGANPFPFVLLLHSNFNEKIHFEDHHCATLRRHK